MLRATAVRGKNVVRVLATHRIHTSARKTISASAGVKPCPARTAWKNGMFEVKAPDRLPTVYENCSMAKVAPKRPTTPRCGRSHKTIGSTIAGTARAAVGAVFATRAPRKPNAIAPTHPAAGTSVAIRSRLDRPGRDVT